MDMNDTTTVKSLLDDITARAQERFAPYEQIDWVRSVQTLSADELDSLRTAAKAAYEDTKQTTDDVNKLRELLGLEG